MKFSSSRLSLPAAPIDAAEVRRAGALLFAPGSNYEIFSMPIYQSMVVPGYDLDRLVEVVNSFAVSRGTYFTINPTQNPPGSTKKTKSSDVLERHHVFVDIDPRKAPDHEKNMATSEERSHTSEVACRINEFLLAECLWPVPAIIDSGSGVQMLWRVSMPNDGVSSRAIKKFLEFVKSKFETEHTIVDASVADSPRMAKMPGTMVRKGTYLPDRPFRMARFFSAPKDLEELSMESLLGVIGHSVKSLVSEANHEEFFRKIKTLPREWGHTGRYAQAIFRSQLLKIQMSVAGQNRNTALNSAAFVAGGLVENGQMSEDDAVSALLAAALEKELSEREAMSTIRSGMQSGRSKCEVRVPPPEERRANLRFSRQANPGGSSVEAEVGDIPDPETPPLPEIPVPEPSKPVNISIAGSAFSGGAERLPLRESSERPTFQDSLIIWGDKVVVRSVDWLWKYRIPRGKLTIFAGFGGLGKSFCLCDISARVTTGAEWPDDSGSAPLGKVLYIAGEDDPDDTIIPRMMACGADVSRVAFFQTSVLHRYFLGNKIVLEDALDEMGSDTNLIVIDPPTNYVGEIDENSNTEVRRLLGPLGLLAQERNLAVVMNTHINKNESSKAGVASRIMGSSAWPFACRAGSVFCLDPTNDEMRVFAPFKSNNGPIPKALRYQILPGEGPDALPVFSWCGVAEMSAEEMFQCVSESRTAKAAAAKSFLISCFREKLEWTSEEILARASGAGLSRMAFFNARIALGMPPARRVMVDGVPTWLHWVPEDWEHFKATSSKAKEVEI